MNHPRRPIFSSHLTTICALRFFVREDVSSSVATPHFTNICFFVETTFFSHFHSIKLILAFLPLALQNQETRHDVENLVPTHNST